MATKPIALRSDHVFISRGSRCSAWLYLPRHVKRPPVVIMAHGFGAERAFGLEPFAERFADVGLATFLFDYRCFGDSDGRPRNWISPRRHLQDWEAALAYVRDLESIDASRMALWGTSFSGGHVIVMAARHKEISAVVAQVPFADGLALLTSAPLKHILRLSMAALGDLSRSIIGCSPLTVPIVGPPDSSAIMNMPGSWEGYRSLLPEDTSWTNACPARAVFTTSFYRPTLYAQRVECPTLFVMADHDEVIPLWSVRREVARVPNAQVLMLSGSHFDVYKGSCFEDAIAAEQDFFVTHLQNQ